MRRREFIAFVGGTAIAWPLAARAQQPGKPVIGFLGTASANGYDAFLASFRDGLKAAGFVEGHDATMSTGGQRVTLIVCRRSRPIW